MQEKLFRIIDLRGKEIIVSDISILDPEFPEYIKMIQIGGVENYEIHQSTGFQYLITGENIYEDDIVKHQGSIYRVIFEPPEFLLELMGGDGSEIIHEDETEKVGVYCFRDILGDQIYS